MFAKKKKKRKNVWIHLTTKYFFTLSQSILNEFWLSIDRSVPASCWRLASFLHDRVCICSWHGRLCSQTIFLEVLLSPCSDRIMSVFSAALPESPKITSIFVLIFSLGPCTARLLQISQSVIILSSVEMISLSKSSQFHFEDHYYKIVP